MNILFAMPWDQHTGGVTHVAATLAASLQTQGHRAFFLFPEPDRLRIAERPSLRGFPSIHCRLRSYPPAKPTLRSMLSWYATALVTLPQLVLKCRAWGVELVDIHYPDEGSALLVELARMLRIPLVVSAHGADLLPDAGPNQGRGLLYQLEAAHAVVAPSLCYLRSIVEAFPVLAGKSHCIHNGYEEGEFAGVVRDPPRTASAGITAVCIAALIQKKGVDVLLRALPLCRSERISVRLIGEGPLRAELESLSNALGLSDRVRFLGSKGRSEVVDELRRADLLVMPSRHASESFGLAALEAMACGKPVVASAIGGLQELVADRQTGLLMRPDDPQALAEALDTLAADAPLRERCGTAGSARAAQFTARLTAERYESLFEELCAQRDRAAPPTTARR